MGIASAIGKPIRVDKNTINVARGRFARVCVEIDLMQPIVGKYWLDGHWYQVEYEGLHLICSKCGCYNHLTQNCNQDLSTMPLPNLQQTIVTVDENAKEISLVMGEEVEKLC